MKKVALVLALGLVASSTFAGGELPSRQYTRPLPVYSTKTVTSEKPSIFRRVSTYFVNRGNDAIDIVSPTVDFVVGVVTFDPERDDQ